MDEWYARAVNITITLGSHDISNYEPNKQRTFTVTSQKVTAHPNFYFGSVENDIALIELPTDVSFSGETFSFIVITHLPSNPNQLNYNF